MCGRETSNKCGICSTCFNGGDREDIEALRKPPAPRVFDDEDPDPHVDGVDAWVAEAMQEGTESD
jgi:hypothetical protein